MEPVIVSPKNDESGSDLSLFWTRRVSLTARILAVNIFALAILAGSFFYLDSYRAQLIDERMEQARQQAAIVASALAQNNNIVSNRTFIADAGSKTKSRIRIYNIGGSKQLDSFAIISPSYVLRDPATEPWRKDAARLLDRIIESIVRAPDVEKFSEPEEDNFEAWPELKSAANMPEPSARFRYAPDRTPFISAAAAIPRREEVVLITENARDITRIVRDQRALLAIIIAIVTVFSVLLSLFLARTIVRPLRRLARAAVRVRLGRAREVVVPRLPERRDEIGMLARALSDMSLALRDRIDATENFAADVSHEIKNPLASLRSALEGLENVSEPELQKQLLEIASSDVRRLDRLITDISEVSRVDAQLSRTKFERVDLGEMIESVLTAREERGANQGRHIAFARPRRGVATVSGEAIRLERVISNLLDNAVSFSPQDALIEVTATRVQNVVHVRVTDCGPGVPESEREAIFRRFHSVRPDDEDFGRHSGLGLAIARTIIEGHNGKLSVCDREDGHQGACFRITLPAAVSGLQILS